MIEERTNVNAKATLRRLVPLLLVVLIAPVSSVQARPAFVEITATARGRTLVAEEAARARAAGRPVRQTRVWEFGPGDYFLADRLPRNLSVRLVRDATTGAMNRVVSFDVEARSREPRSAVTAVANSAGPSWIWLDAYCFGVIQNLAGRIDSCFALHGMVGESDPRDFYQLEQFGTISAKFAAKIYAGFVEGVKASSGSAPMSWIDWSPRGSLVGGCHTVGISVSALGVSIGTSALMCERWDITKWIAPGHFRNTWSCGCIHPFGQPYPNTREVKYMQVVSVPNGGVPRWTLSAGVTAR